MRSRPASMKAICRSGVQPSWRGRTGTGVKGKSGLSWCWSTNPLLRFGYKGTIGLKTGSTNAAGICLVAVVHRGTHTLGVVLLHSPNIGAQAMQLFNAGFRALRGA